MAATRLSAVLVFLRTTWVIAVGLFGLIIGASVGYANEGWIGAIILGAVGYLMAATLAAMGRYGVEMLLSFFGSRLRTEFRGGLRARLLLLPRRLSRSPAIP